MLPLEHNSNERLENSPKTASVITTSSVSSNQKNIILCKCAFFISVLTLLLVLIIFYSLTRNMQGITNEIASFETFKKQTASYDTHLKMLATKITALEDYAARQKTTETILRAAMRETLIDQAASQLGYVVSQLKEDDKDADLRKAIALIQQYKKQNRKNIPATALEPAP